MKEKNIDIDFNRFSEMITIEKIVFSILLVIIFSYEFHALWLLYDILALGSILFFIKQLNYKLITILIISVIFFISMSIISGSHIISFLSIWDNLKHVFPMFMLFSITERYMHQPRMNNFLSLFGWALFFIFLLQMCLVFFQYYLGYYYDDISGTFGVAGSHSICYFCLMYIAYLLYVKKSYFTTLIVFIISLIMNYFSENMGFYPLVILLISLNWLSFKKFKYLFIYGISFIIIVFLLDLALNGQILKPIIYRFSEFLSPPDFKVDKLTPSRGFMSILAFLLGGFFGAGPGCFSYIYSIEPWLSIEPIQIDISSFTIIVAEYGLVGMFFWLMIFGFFLARFFSSKKYFIFVFSFFLFCFLYNKILNDERIFVMFLFTLFSIKCYTEKYRKII